MNTLHPIEENLDKKLPIQHKTINSQIQFWLFIGYICLIPLYELYRNLISKESFSISILMQYVAALGVGSLTFEVGKLIISVTSNKELLTFIETTVKNGLEMVKGLIDEMKVFTQDIFANYAEQREKEIKRNAKLTQEILDKVERLSRAVSDSKREIADYKAEMENVKNQLNELINKNN